MRTSSKWTYGRTDTHRWTQATTIPGGKIWFGVKLVVRLSTTSSILHLRETWNDVPSFSLYAKSDIWWRCNNPSTSSPNSLKLIHVSSGLGSPGLSFCILAIYLNNGILQPTSNVSHILQHTSPFTDIDSCWHGGIVLHERLYQIYFRHNSAPFGIKCRGVGQ